MAVTTRQYSVTKETVHFDEYVESKYEPWAVWVATGDGFVDVADFNLWNTYKFTSSDSIVPEQQGPVFT